MVARCWAEIDRAALRHNADVAARLAGGAGKLIAVVKADAYGHGAVTVARILQDRVAAFAVADVAEASILREAGIPNPILLLSPLLEEEFKAAGELRAIATVSSAEEAERLGTAAPGCRVNLKVDTGMGRQGIHESAALETVEAIANMKSIRFTAVSTHLPSADVDADFTGKQLERFARMTAKIKQRCPELSCHCLNSAGLMCFPEHAMDAVRPGLMLYGVPPVTEHAAELRPVMTWKTRVALVRSVPAGAGISYQHTFVTERPSQLATLAMGYADGYPRRVFNSGAEVLIRGVRCPVVGVVTMDQTVVDVSHVPGGVYKNDEVVLLGAGGNERITAAQLAVWAGSIPWEILTRVGPRVRRVGI